MTKADDSTNSPAHVESQPTAAAPEAPTVVSRKLFNQHGPVTRRKILAAASGIAGVMLGERLLAPLRAEAQTRGLLPWLSGGGGVYAPETGGGGARATGDVVDIGKMRLPVTEPLGDYLWLTPTKLGGGAHLQDLASGRTLAWIAYWNYGDSCPIAHHLAAFPSPDPRKNFEFVNSTQGGQNVLIYGIPSLIEEHGMLEPMWGQGNQIYRVGFDGQQMNLLENIAETTGIGLGVHTVIYPDASGFSCSDGQKDVVAFFNRATGYGRTEVQAAFRFDWYGKDPSSTLEENFFGGGRVRISKLVPALETGKFDYRGTKGNKLDWEMVPMGEYLAYTGQLPGSAVRNLTGADNTVHHPGNRFSMVTLRMFACGIVIDRTTMEPIACISSPEGTPKENLPVKKVADGIWDIEIEKVVTSGHECGFSPDGRWFTMTNNTRQNSMGVFDCSDADPRKWKRVTHIKDARWTGETPSPFHIAFSIDGTKMFVSELHRKPARSSVLVIDTATWKTIKRFDNVGVDCQTMAPSYDGKFVFQIFSGFQRLEAGTFVFRQDTLEPVGFLPNFGGHHDCVIVPRNNKELLHSRCTTV
jgi:thiocyanate desulfurase